MTDVQPDPLSWFEAPRPFVKMALSVLRLSNTALDALFYDVNTLAKELFRRGWIVTEDAEGTASSRSRELAEVLRPLHLNALSDPEGSILIVDAARSPYVSAPYLNVGRFVSESNARQPPIRNLSVTGVGSSALGSVAFAWDLSKALSEPVAAIVPGYGVADVVQQALGGWLGFGMQSWWLKTSAQEMLVNVAPQMASVGRQLMMTAPHEKASNGAPLFQRGCGSSDVLHEILKKVPKYRAPIRPQ